MIGVNRTVTYGKFEWDLIKDEYNQKLHKVSFNDATQAFLDPNRVFIKDEKHSETEERIFCIGMVNNKVATVRFTMRGEKIRILGAGFWRKERILYEKQNKK